MTTTIQSADDFVPAIREAEEALDGARIAQESGSGSYLSVAEHHDLVAKLYKAVSRMADGDTFAYHAATWLYARHHVDAELIRANPDLMADALLRAGDL